MARKPKKQEEDKSMKAFTEGKKVRKNFPGKDGEEKSLKEKTCKRKKPHQRGFKFGGGIDPLNAISVT